MAAPRAYNENTRRKLADLVQSCRRAADSAVWLSSRSIAEFNVQRAQCSVIRSRCDGYRSTAAALQNWLVGSHPIVQPRLH